MKGASALEGLRSRHPNCAWPPGRLGGPLTSRNYPLATIPWVATKSALQKLCWFADAIAAARSRFRRTCGARAHQKTNRSLRIPTKPARH